MADTKFSKAEQKLLHDLIPPGLKDPDSLSGFLKANPDIEKQIPYSIKEIWQEYAATAPTVAPLTPAKETANTKHKVLHGLSHEDEEDTDGISLSDALLNNEHYQNIIQNTVDDWNKEHPDQKINQAFITDENGKRIINPEITGKGNMPGKIQDIEKRATDTYTMAYGTSGLKKAQIAEKNKVYKKMAEDPLFARMQKEISLGITPSDEAYKQFARRYPAKAQGYMGKLRFRRGKEYHALKNAIRAIERERKDQLDGEKKKWKDWDNEYKKARRRNPNAVHGGVAQLHSEVAKAADALREADQKQGFTLSNDVYIQRAQKAELERRFRDEPGKMQYLAKRDPELAKQYEAWKKEQKIKAEKEAKERVDANKRFNNPNDDPRLQKLHGDIRSATAQEYQRQLEESRKGKGRYIRGIWHPDPNANYQPPDRQAIEAKIRQGKLLDFANANPELVKDYAKKDPELASAYKAYQEEQRQKEQAKKLGEKRGFFARFFGRNEGNAEGLTLGGKVENPKELIEPQIESKPSPPPDRPQPVSTSPAREPQAEKQKSFRDRIRERFRRVPQQPQEQAELPQSITRRSPIGSAKKHLGSAIDKRTGGKAGRLNNQLKGLQGKLPGGGKLPTNPKDAAKKLAQEAAKKAFLSPQSLTGIGIAILIIFFFIITLAVWYAIFGAPEEEPPPALLTPTPPIGGATPVASAPASLAINKTGPTNVGNGETITYTITVTGSGDIKVVDRISGKAEFVEATPEPSEITTNGEGNLQTATWNLTSATTITLIVRPTQDDSYISNIASLGELPQENTESPQPIPKSPSERQPEQSVEGFDCPVIATFQPFTSYEAIGENNMSWICEHCHEPLSTHRSIDMGTYPGGGTPVGAITDGVASRMGPPNSDAPSIVLLGDDGMTYFYTHLSGWTIPQGEVRVTAGQELGTIAAAGAPGSFNNNVAHLHIQASSNGDNFNPDTYIGPLLDNWCGVNVCNGNQSTCGL